MRGPEEKQSSMLALVSPSSIIPTDHPLRQLKVRAGAALAAMSPLFEQMYSTVGRPSIPPETLLKGQLLIALYAVPSERQLCEQRQHNFLYRSDGAAVAGPFLRPTTTTKRPRWGAEDA